VVSALVALVLYPVSFARELPHGNRSVWEFGWVKKKKSNLHFWVEPRLNFNCLKAYGVAWGAAIFLFGASVLLMCDKEAEEVYYKERDVHLAEKSGTN
jgi:multidrug efflux pump subunit AcrB